jgi:hypothetical protein
MISMRYLVRIAVSVLLAMMPASALAAPATAPAQVWEKQENTLTATEAFPNTYTDARMGFEVDIDRNRSPLQLTSPTCFGELLTRFTMR